MPLIKMYVHSGFVGADHRDELEVDEEKWNDMDEKERKQFLDDTARDYMHNCIEYGAYVEKDEA